VIEQVVEAFFLFIGVLAFFAVLLIAAVFAYTSMRYGGPRD
jgi:hypothetical protein